MNSKSNLNSNSLSEVCKRKEEEDPAQNEKLNPAQTAKPQPAHGHPFLFSAPGPSHRPKPAQATQPAISSLPSRVRPSSLFLGPPFFFPSWPGLPSPPARSAARASPSHQRPRARLPATLTRSQAHTSAPRSSSTPPHAHNTAPGPACRSPAPSLRPSRAPSSSRSARTPRTAHPRVVPRPAPHGPLSPRRRSPADPVDPRVSSVFSASAQRSNGCPAIPAGITTGTPPRDPRRLL